MQTYQELNHAEQCPAHRPAATARLIVAWLAAALLLAAGCSATETAEIGVPLPPSVIESEPVIVIAPAPPVAPVPRGGQAPPVGRSVQGRAIRCSVHGNGEEVVLILGGIHGDEPAGVPLCEQLAVYLAQNGESLDGRQVVVVPAANPDGLAANRRVNARGVDVNRNFDARNRVVGKANAPAALSEPESRFIAELIRRYRPSRIVTVHQPLACVDYDGPAGGLAAAVAEACGLPVRKLGALPGSLGSYAGLEEQIPIVTLELPRNAARLAPPELWRRYGQAMLTAIHYRDASAVQAK